ncbi:MAG: FG-GAP repeat domain-containing protein [Planctomycetaceae bacterium]
MRWQPAFVFLLGLAALSNLHAEELTWKRLKIDDRFRSEGVSVADVNKDGKNDIIHGLGWYEAPQWTYHEIRENKDYGDGSGSYSNSFADFAHDLNGDGWTDVICIDFPGTPCYWFENPKGAAGPWKQHEIWHSAANETPLFTDVTGDGKPDLVFSSETEGLVGYLEIPAGEAVTRKWNFVAVNTDKRDPVPQGTPPDKFPTGTFRYYHGLGAGDVNRDGRVDILIPHGWWEAPPREQLGKGVWKWHPLNLTPDGKPGYLPASDMYTEDLDLDGDADILMSAAHNVGIWWFENLGGAEPEFKYHLISEQVTQTHALHVVDLDGDGDGELDTGKRWWAHGPKGDVRPDADPVVIWFDITRQKEQAPKFTPHVIPESSGSGVGTQFTIADLDGNKTPDIILSNKKGVNVLLQMRGAKTAAK